jgi:hypothetical protein
MIDANYGSVICLCSWCLSSVLGSAVVSWDGFYQCASVFKKIYFSLKIVF